MSRKKVDKGKNLHCFIERSLYDKTKERAEFLGLTVTDALHEALKMFITQPVNTGDTK